MLLRALLGAGVRNLTRATGISREVRPASARALATLATLSRSVIPAAPVRTNLLQNTHILSICANLPPVRTVTKFSLKSGKRKSVKSAIIRFYRLNWGGWIHTKCGRQKKMWKKSAARRRRLKQHVFCNATQSTLLDKMVTKFWKRPKYYVDDPYAPYHTREEFNITRKNPIVRD